MLYDARPADSFHRHQQDRDLFKTFRSNRASLQMNPEFAGLKNHPQGNGQGSRHRYQTRMKCFGFKRLRASLSEQLRCASAGVTRPASSRSRGGQNAAAIEMGQMLLVAVPFWIMRPDRSATVASAPYQQLQRRNSSMIRAFRIARRDLFQRQGANIGHT